jgi:MazG family protein
MHAVIAEEEGEFTLREVVDGITGKLIRRHPHVFGDAAVRDAEHVRRNWEQLKLDEGRTSALDGVPPALPALQRALRVQEKAAHVGFDWERAEDAWVKVREETEELHAALASGSRRKAEEEFGDLLFALVNYARFRGIHPENALRATVDKFTRRFRYIENELRKRGREPRTSTLEEMDALWNRAKRGRR